MREKQEATNNKKEHQQGGEEGKGGCVLSDDVAKNTQWQKGMDNFPFLPLSQLFITTS
jgi:hypothetical protein